MTPRCHLCGNPIKGAWATVTFEGFTTLRLNGVTFVVDAKCLRFEPADREIPLPARISDPVAEPELVYVEQDASDWFAICRVHGNVAMKDNSEDAHLGAARHIARVHIGAVA